MTRTAAPETLFAVTPFAEQDSDRIDRFGEAQLLRFVREWLGDSCPPCPRGIGDDVAVLPPGGDGERFLLTNDSLVWGRHFDETAGPGAAGRKLLKRNLSDIAAMGGRPAHAVLGLCCGGDVSLAWLTRFFTGLGAEAVRWNCEINGGDLAQSGDGTFAATLALLGRCGHPVPRNGGETDSWIWVTGSLGGSILGHHLDFEPRLAEGRWLSEGGETLAMMDLTDGLAHDLPEMVPPGLQARLDLAFVPISDGARASAQDSGKPAVWHAFTDGEDYELAFVTRAGIDPTRFEARWRERFPGTPLAPVGTFVTAPPTNGSTPPKVAGLDGQALFGGAGFEHFRDG